MTGSERGTRYAAVLELVDLRLEEAREEALSAALDAGVAAHAELRSAARGWEPEMVFDPRWD